MKTLDEWEEHALRAKKALDEYDDIRERYPHLQLEEGPKHQMKIDQTKILALIDLIRKKDQALDYIAMLGYNSPIKNIDHALNFCVHTAYEGKKLTEDL